MTKIKNITGIFLLWCIFCFGISPLHGKSTGIDPTFKIQGAFLGITPVEQGEKRLRLLKQYGLNTALVSDSRYTVKEDLWPEWGEIAEKYDICLFPIHCFAGTDETKVFKEKYTPYVNRNGKIFPSTPCPLDAGYWSTSIAERFEQLAAISKRTSISGLLFDTEMYGGDFSIYTDFCFCDICWKEFIQTTSFFLSGKDLAVYNLAPDKRFTYLRQHRLLQQYADYQEKQIEAILSRIEQQIHSINPDLWLGFLGYRNNWFYRGLIRGLGIPTRPVLVFSESSYIQGYTPYITQERMDIRQLRQTEASHTPEPSQHPIARYIPGLWQGRFFPEDIPSQLYHLATHTDGYWIFSADSLWDDTLKPTHWHYTLHGSDQDYWTAFKKANDELNQFVSSLDTYNSNLPPVYLSSCYDSVQQHLSTQPSLRYFWYHVWPQFITSVRSQEQDSQHMPVCIYRGTTLFHGFKHPEQSGISQKARQMEGTIHITHIPLGFSPDLTTYTLFNEQGMILQEGTLSQQNPSTTLRLPSDISGMFSLLTDSRANLAKVSFSGFPYVIEASSTFPLKTFSAEQTYAAYGSPEKNRLTLRTYCSSSEESALLIVQSPEGRIHKETEIVEFTELNIPFQTSQESIKQEQHQTYAPPQLSLQMIYGQAIPFPMKQEGHIFWNNPSFLAITIAPVPAKLFEDVQLYLYNEKFPYLIPRNSSTWSYRMNTNERLPLNGAFQQSLTADNSGNISVTDRSNPHIQKFRNFDCQENTLCNGDFEQHLVSWQNTQNVTFTTGRSGQGIQVAYDHANSDIYQLINGVFEPGKSYRVTAWCLAEVGEQCRLFFGDANTLQNPTPYEHEAKQILWGNGRWQQLSVGLTLNHEERMDVYLYSKIPGSTVTYDDVNIEEVSTYTLTVVKTGAGTGTVTGNGIDCGSDCSKQCFEGIILNLRAIPDAGSTFAGWLVNGHPITGALQIDETVIVTAIFEKK
jgi:hypothetical protein